MRLREHETNFFFICEPDICSLNVATERDLKSFKSFEEETFRVYNV